jgi:excisionase family DNA binding protein
MRIVVEIADADLKAMGSIMGESWRLQVAPSGETGPRPGLPLLLTVSKAAELLSIGKSRCYELLAAGRLPSVRLGSSRRIPLETLMEFINGLAVD